MKKWAFAVAAVAVVAILSTCSGPIGQALVDAGHFLQDSGVAHADDSGVEPPNTPVRMLTADTDATRLESGIVYLDGPKLVVTGPIVMTSLGLYGGSARWWISPVGACTVPSHPEDLSVSGNDGSIVGQFVRAGQQLCASYGSSTVEDNSFAWSGYRPY
ncbi:MAG: hypothetical protein QM765_29155 [Myxococcales bacterium]